MGVPTSYQIKQSSREGISGLNRKFKNIEAFQTLHKANKKICTVFRIAYSGVTASTNSI